MTHATNDPYAPILESASRELSDLDEVRELGEWFMGGNCRALGAVIDHGGDPYQIVVTGGDGIAYPTDSDEVVAVGVYGGRDEDYELGIWAVAVDVRIDEVEAVVAYLVRRVHADRPSELALERPEWLALVRRPVR